MSQITNGEQFNFTQGAQMVVSNPVILLVGKTGAGKSTLGNLLLNQPHDEGPFLVSADMESVTKECATATMSIDGVMYNIIDTPGIFDTQQVTDEMIKEISETIQKCICGIKAILFVFEATRFTEEQKNVLKGIRSFFGEEATDYIIAVFSHATKKQTSDRIVMRKSWNDPVHSFINEIENRWGISPDSDYFPLEDPVHKARLGEIKAFISSMQGVYTAEQLENVRREQEESRRQKEEEEKRKRQEHEEKLKENARKEAEEAHKREIERIQREERERKEREEKLKEEERKKAEEAHKREIEQMQREERERKEREENLRRKEQQEAEERHRQMVEKMRQEKEREENLRKQREQEENLRRQREQEENLRRQREHEENLRRQKEQEENLRRQHEENLRKQEQQRIEEHRRRVEEAERENNRIMEELRQQQERDRRLQEELIHHQNHQPNQPRHRFPGIIFNAISTGLAAVFKKV